MNDVKEQGSTSVKSGAWGSNDLADQLRIQNLITLGVLTSRKVVPAGHSPNEGTFIDIVMNEGALTQYHLKSSDLNAIRRALKLSKVAG